MSCAVQRVAEWKRLLFIAVVVSFVIGATLGKQTTELLATLLIVERRPCMQLRITRWRTDREMLEETKPSKVARDVGRRRD